jgi:ABC-2 type transport system ATP-binding protein
VAEAEKILSVVAHGALRVHAEEGEISAPVPQGVEALSTVLRNLESAGIDIVDIGLRRPTLDDVFMELTGHEATAEEEKK